MWGAGSIARRDGKCTSSERHSVDVLTARNLDPRKRLEELPSRVKTHVFYGRRVPSDRGRMLPEAPSSGPVASRFVSSWDRKIAVEATCTAVEFFSFLSLF